MTLKSRIIGGVGAIIQAATNAAEKAKDANYIHISWTGTKAVVTTHVNGIDAAWIELDADQLDEMIRIATLARSEMGG